MRDSQIWENERTLKFLDIKMKLQMNQRIVIVDVFKRGGQTYKKSNGERERGEMQIANKTDKLS